MSRYLDSTNDVDLLNTGERVPARRYRRHIVPTEHEECVALMQWVALEGRKRPELLRIFAIPNGGARHPATAGKLKAEGVRPGVPDYFLPVARGCYHGLFLEMKRRGEKPRADQARELVQLQEDGYLACWAAGCDEARRFISEYLDMEDQRQ